MNRLSLAEVAERSGNEFKASSLGAYERGDREISVRRLQRLAEVYGVRPDALLQVPKPKVIDLVGLERQEVVGLVLVLSRFRTSSDPRALAIMNFAAAIKSLRKEASSSVLVARASDSAILATLLGLDPAELARALTTGFVADHVDATVDHRADAVLHLT